MDWKELIQMSPRNLEDHQKDELSKTIMWLDDINDINLNKLKKLFKLSQEILKYKDEQVESLISEFDEIARKQGIEEAKMIQSFENEIKSLKSSSESHLQTPDMDLLKENEQMKIKIKTLKSTLKSQSQEIDKLKLNIMNLEEEKNMIQSELLHSAHQDDNNSEQSDVSEKYQYLTENIKQKNKQISQLLNDIETVEKDNITLKEEVVILKNELIEATEHMSSMAAEISGHKNGLKEINEKLSTASDENTALRNQIKDLVNQKNEREKEINDFSIKLDKKIDELNALLKTKLIEIKELKQEISKLENKIIEYTNKIPSSILAEKDEQIEELQLKLIEATKEIEKNTILLNEIKSSRKQKVTDIEQDTITDDLKSQLLAAHERCQDLQTLLQSTELDAQTQGKQLVELMNQIRKYEEGQYGLSDALREIQDLRVQINIRDKQITELIQTCNKYQAGYDEIEYENLTLREKCGLPLDVPSTKNIVISKQRKQKKIINNLQNQIEILEEEKMQLKVDLQKYKRLISKEKLDETTTKTVVQDEQMKTETVSTSDIIDYKKKYIEVSEENESLRKGMHEILDSIRTKKGTSNKEIKSESLEQLIHILDSRHVSGWYHPAMKLQAQINTMQGINEELRNQLKFARNELSTANEQLQQSEIKYHELKVKLKDSSDQLATLNTNQVANLIIPPNISTTSAEIISKLNSHLLVVLNEYKMEVENVDTLKEKLENYKQEMSVVKQQISLLYKQFITEKNTLQSKYEEILTEKDNLSGTLQNLQIKLNDCLISDKSDTESTANQKFINDFIILNRKCLYLEDNEKKLSNDHSKLKLDMCQMRASFCKNIKQLEIENNNLTHKLSILENHLRDSVPKLKLDKANKEFYELTIKHRELLQNVHNFKESSNIEAYKKEIELLNTEKDNLFFELLQLKSQKYAAQHANDEIVIVTKKMANLELNVLSECQRADHINSLYELVKEQLKKCEERCAEYENQNKLLSNKNLKLQLNLQEQEDKFINSVTIEEYKQISEKLITTEEEFIKLKNNYDKVTCKNNIIENEIKTREMLKSCQNMELMNLKHLLLDLQSTSDEKALIARLSTEVVLARICEADVKNRLDILNDELTQTKENLKQKEICYNEIQEKLNNIQNQHQIKLRILEQILYSLRSQYMGCNPLYSQERNVNILRQIYNDKQTVFNELLTMQKQKTDIMLLQEQLNLELKNTTELKATFSKDHSNFKNERMLEWYKEKHTLQLSEFKYRRTLEIKENELKQLLERITDQDKEFLQLEEALLKANNNILQNLFISSHNTKTLNTNATQTTNDLQENQQVPESKQFSEIGTDPIIFETPLHRKSIEIQTIPIVETSKYEDRISTLQNEIQKNKELISLKDSNLKRQEMLIADLEKNIKQLEEQTHAKEEQSTVAETTRRESRNNINVIDEVDMQEHNALKQMVTKLQLMITQKEEMISKYEKLLKEGKDEHSLAASRFQEEIKQLQINLNAQQQAYQELKDSKSEQNNSNNEVLPNKSVIEQYVSQVHILEGHMDELQTSVSSLKSQLHASRQESVRWRSLANDRINTIETLRKEFDEQHEEEISTYKNETEKYKEETISLKQELSKVRVELNQKNLKIAQDIQEKDTKIHEFTMTIMQLKNELKMHEETEKLENNQKYSELELIKQILETEYETLKKRHEQLITREKAAEEEVRNLRKQLIKRPILSVRSDKSDKSIKEQLQKKIVMLEKELSEANEKLEKDAALNEMRRGKIAEDFTLWEKQKRWQQTAEKTKEKLTNKIEELEKVQQSYNSAKSIISRLEREKHILESRLKSSKSSVDNLNSSRVESMVHENIQLKNEIELLTTKLEMQQHHSGGLGAAMLQEKLEAQERKIAILELSAKGSVEITAELERLNNTISSLQKANLRLESENLELNLDLKKAASDAPHIREQIQHLERYIEVLKSEQSEHHVVTNAGDQLQPSNKKILQLEKTVLSLRRLVEKLQAENKRLQSRPCSSNSDRKLPQGAVPDKHQQELKKIREQYSQSVQRSTKLENELSKSQKRVRFLENAVVAKQAENESSLSNELADVKQQLAHKSQLLDKVKILLQKAALKEKFLQDQVEQLQTEKAKLLASERTETEFTETQGEAETGYQSNF